MFCDCKAEPIIYSLLDVIVLGLVRVIDLYSSKKLSTFSKKIGKSIEDLEIDDLVLLVEQRWISFYLNDPEEKIYFCWVVNKFR